MNKGRPPSRLSLRRPSGILFWAAAFLLFAGFVVPLIHANRFRGQIQAALENALGRKVEIGEVTLNLLTGPGFRLENVSIGEDPAFGAEHFAYMSSMQARLRLRTLWTGRVQLASLTLVEPSINLVKNRQGRWNLEALMERAGAGPGGPASETAEEAYFPYIGIDAGRVNFKFGDYKNVFYIRDVEAAISPPRDAGGRWWMRFGGTPARTDRRLGGMGRVTGQGSLTGAPGGGAPRAVNVELALGTSPVAHLLALTHGRDLGVHGKVDARVRLSGEISRVGVQGTLQMTGVHRWDLLPSEESRFSVPFRGVWNLPRQELRLGTDAALPSPATVRVGFTLENYLSTPRWSATVELDRADAAPVAGMARHFGVALPDQVELRGALAGRLDFPGSPWPHGALTLREGQLLLPDSPSLAIGPAEVRLAGPAFELPPAEVRIPGRGGGAVVEISASGKLDGFRLSALVVASGAPLDTLRQPAALLNPSWLASLSKGQWDGRVVYRKEVGKPGVWGGSGTLSEARWQPEGLESPVEIAKARLRWEPGAAEIQSVAASVGETNLTGSCRRKSAAATPAESRSACKLRIEDLELAQLDRWLNPKQERSLWAVWKRTLGSRSRAPSWFQSLNVRGDLRVDRLRVGQWSFQNIRSELAFAGGTLSLDGLRAELDKAPVSGTFKAELAGAVPRYSLQATARGVDLKSLAAAALPLNFRRGSADLRLELAAAGRNASRLLAGLKATGAFDARSVTLDNVEWKDADGDTDDSLEIRSLEGQFAWTRTGLELTKMQLRVGPELYEGRGLIGGRPQVVLELVSEGKQARLLSASVPEAPAGGP